MGVERTEAEPHGDAEPGDGVADQRRDHEPGYGHRHGGDARPAQSTTQAQRVEIGELFKHRNRLPGGGSGPATGTS